MSTELRDLMGGTSNCCGALMYEDYGICSDCKEHCENEDESCRSGDGCVEGKPMHEGPCIRGDDGFSFAQLAQIAAWEKQCKDAGCDDNGHKHD